ncbi:uncharacterized protein LOC104908464 isoform X2 [Beta vulgaris subsp. vulgaris]|uniref:uncharacterized protein LOC104908464 isoform X2 n=1 Tax=Beta vulgaris subsp. vulgaris TaxID=3555 RepID=UPI002036D954|nr:uncharacterized protein LOC104908464 isoform X2 [Beta vulgaris subsp. vulgaris]
MVDRRRLEAILSTIVNVKPHETSALLHSATSFFFILSAYFVVLPLRDEGAISLGLSNLPGLFIGSLLLTLIAAPLSTLLFSLPNLSKGRALVLIHRFFSLSLVLFFILWHTSTNGFTMKLAVAAPLVHDQNFNSDHSNVLQSGWDDHSWYYIFVRMGLFLWIALLNLITISSTWARVIDVMNSESGSRLFGFIGAGATLGQLFGSLFAAGMAWLGSFLLLVAAFLMELAAQSSKGISQDAPHLSEEDTPMIKLDDQESGVNRNTRSTANGSSPKIASTPAKPQLWVMFDGLWLILASSYLIYVSLFLWLSAVVSSFFYFQKVSIIALTTSSAAGRRKLFAEINSFIALFIFSGQITLTGRILTVAGVTVAICCAPVVALVNMVAISAWPTWIVIAACETLRKVVMYVVTRPGRELLFTVVSQEEKYKAKVCIDVIVQRLGDATAAGMFQLLFGTFKGRTSTLSLYALPRQLCLNLFPPENLSMRTMADERTLCIADPCMLLAFSSMCLL